MSAGGAMPAGSSRMLRLDPFALPVRYKASDAGADERERLVEVHRERVVLRRAVRGIRMEISTPITAYLGVVLRIVPPSGEDDGAVALMLEHRDPGLTVPLFMSGDGSEASVEWQTWARVLGLPLLVADADGTLRDPFAAIGRAIVGEPEPRRRGAATIAARRPRIRMRRKPGALSTGRGGVHRGEREIIARD